MAAPASERRAGAIAQVIGLLAPFPGRLEFATRLALVAALTALVAEIYQTPEPALTIYVAFFLIKPDRMTSVILSIVMVLLLTIILTTILFLSMVVLDDPLWRVATMALLSFALLFLASASKLKPVAGIIALISAFALDRLGTVPGGEVATRALLYAWLFVGIPAGVALAVNLLMGPSPRSLIEQVLAHRLRLSAAMLREPDSRQRHAFRESLQEGFEELQSWLKMAAIEKTSPPKDLAALRQAVQSTALIMMLVDVAAHDPDATPPESSRHEVANVLDEMAAILAAGAYPTKINLNAPGDVDAGAHTAKALATDATAGGPMAEGALADLHEALAHFAEPPTDVATPSAKAPAGGFFSADAFSNVVHVRYALKTTAAAMICYATYMVLDWPGIHTCLITCYIVSLGTAAETMEKLTLRVSGALIGAAAGLAAIVFLMPYVTSIGGLMAIVFLAVLASAWVAGGSPRIGYVGFQMAFAFLLCVVQGSSPAFDLSIARDRVVGIVFGNLVAALLSVSMWPVSVGQRVDPAIVIVLRRLGEMAKAKSRPQRIALATEAQASLTALEGTLDLVRYEPATVAPARRWLEGRRRVATAIAALGGPLLLSLNRGEGANADFAGRLDDLADRLDHSVEASTAPTADASLRQPGAGVGLLRTVQPITDKVVFHLKTLERVLAEEIAERAEGSDLHARP